MRQIPDISTEVAVSKPLRALILEDSEADVALMLYELRQAGFQPQHVHVETEAAYLAHLQQDLDVILADYTLPQFDALRALELLQERGLDIPFIVVTGTVSEEAAVESIKRGAADYFLKDRLARLGPAVDQALQAKRLRDEKRQIDEQVRRQNRELTLLNRIIAASAAGLEEKAILETACRELALALDVPHAVALIFNQQRTALVVAAEHLPQASSLALGMEIPLTGEFPLMRLVAKKEPLVVHDARTDPGLTPLCTLISQEGALSLLFLPLIVDDLVIGGLCLGAVEQRRFSKDNITLVKSVIDQLSGALARARLDAERRRLSAASEQTADCVIITDIKGTILYVNRAFERITGYSRTEAIGQNPRMLKSGQHDAAFYRELWSALLAGKNWRGRFVNKKKDGTLYTADASISPTRDEKGNIVNFVDVQRDITRELELEQQYLQAQKMEAIGRLAGGVAHDFNNLLTAITGYAELTLRALDERDPLHAHLIEIQRAAERASALTKQLLVFSRKQTIQPEVLNLNDLLRDIKRMLRRLIGEDIELHTSLDPELGSVKADAGQLEQIVMNLAVNARDAMPQGGRLDLETANIILGEADVLEGSGLCPGPYVRLVVSDTGVGMDEQVRLHAFEPFFTTKEAGKGTGLGLATVHGIVKQNKGDIRLYSRPGQGTRFEIYLPQVEGDRQDSRDRPLQTLVRGTETILLVEDEDIVRELTRKALVRQGYTVLVASHPEEALHLVAQYKEPIHLLLTDVVMPGMGGPHLAARMQALRPDIRVLYVSGYADDVITHQGVLDAEVAFLPKPFSASSLSRKVHEVLNTPRKG
jgi:two-component system cell cycle sensor histidine kinase/response regulator CckA